MLGNIKHASSDRWSSGHEDQNFYNREQGIKPIVENMSQSRWKGQVFKQNKLAKSANFVSKFKTRHAIEEPSQYLELRALKNHKTVLIAKLLKDLDLLT